MEIPSGREELIYQQNGANSVVAISKDGKTLVTSRSGVELSLDNDLYAIDLNTKKATHLTPHRGAAQFGDVHFLPSDRSIVFGTNSEGQFYGLNQMDLATLKTRAIDKANWDLDNVALARNGSQLAYSQNREGFSEIYLRKIDTSEKESSLVIKEKSTLIYQAKELRAV
jgi:Tol biopolymer transport system component